MKEEKQVKKFKQKKTKSEEDGMENIFFLNNRNMCPSEGKKNYIFVRLVMWKIIKVRRKV